MNPPDPTPHGPHLTQIRWSGLTHVGRVRPNNEDAFLAMNFNGHGVSYLGKAGSASLDGADYVFAVSDGLGGARSGEFASKIAVERITRLLPGSFRLSAAGIAGGFAEILAELFSAIHSDLLKLGFSYAECAGMGATLSLCWFRPEWMYFAHIGDSRIYYLPEGGPMAQITHDHTHVGWMRRKGELNEREARTHPRRNALHQSLGAGNQFVDPHIGSVGYRAGDRFLICSDGLVDGLWDRRIEEILREPPGAAGGPDAAQRLVDEAVENSGRDNTTALLVEIPPQAGARPTNLIFVYGTLKKGGHNHHFMAGQVLEGTARTLPGFTLFDMGGYPGLVPLAGDSQGVQGELWSVDDECLKGLDILEGTSEGLYRREVVALGAPFNDRRVEAYFYARGVEGRARIGPEWNG